MGGVLVRTRSKVLEKCFQTRRGGDGQCTRKSVVASVGRVQIIQIYEGQGILYILTV